MEFILLQQMYNLLEILKRLGKSYEKIYIILAHIGTALPKII